MSELEWRSVKVTAAELGDEWPFTVDEVVITARGERGVGPVVVAAEGTTYAVNGLARQAGEWPEVESIWAENNEYPGMGLRKSIEPIITRGHDLIR
jgi:hypothetical protein